MAAAQAAYLALLGAVLGVLVGLAQGVAISRIITADYSALGMDLSTVVIDIPWRQILLPVLLVPVVAGALAWVSSAALPPSRGGSHERPIRPAAPQPLGKAARPPLPVRQDRRHD